MNEPEPNKLLSFNENEQKARENLTNYTPHWFERTFGLAKNKERVPERNLMCLNFNNIAPSDAMENFVHNMVFTKTKGFKEVKKLEISHFKI